MANDTPNIRAALQTISQASTKLLTPYIWELCEANATIAKAILSFSQNFCKETGQLDTLATDLATLDNTGIENSQA